MRRRHTTRALAGGLLALATALSPAALAQKGEADFYRAFYLQHEAGDLEGAQELYLRARADRKLDASLRVQAEAALAELREDLATSDFARLMPADSILYVELNRPGAQVSALLEQLGLLRGDGDLTAFGVSPKLLEGALGLRGAALAVTEIDPSGGPPKAVLILHPGDRDALRGLIETGLPSAGTPVEAIDGHPTWQLEQQAYVSLTSRLVVASNDPRLIEGVLGRLEHGGDSLASQAGFQKVHSLRGDDLLFFHVNAEPVLPMLRYALEQEARNDPDTALAMQFLDVDSLRSLSGRIGVNAEGIGLDLALTLADDHRNLLFNLMRMPAVSAQTLALVPEGAAFFGAASFNAAAPVAPVSGTPERPIVTAMDFGREVFANLVDVVIYGLAPEEGSARGGPLPEIALCLRVNDPQRSKALWNFVLGLASQSTGAASMEPELLEIAGVAAERYTLQGIPVFLVMREHEMLVSPSRSAIERTLAARAANQSVLQDPLFAGCFESLSANSTRALVLSPGRCAAMALPFAPQHEADKLHMAAELLAQTVVCVGLEQSDTRLALRARVGNLPNVSALVAQALRSRRGAARHGREVRAVQTTPTRVNPAAAGVLREKFDQLATQESELRAARAVGAALIEALDEQPVALNDFAWALLTESHYGSRFAELARQAALRSNELTGYENWALLDTLALAEFEAGDIARAIELERKALEQARGTGREAEVETTLERFLEAQQAAERARPATASAKR